MSDWNRLHLPLWPGVKDSLRKVVLGWVSSVHYSNCSGFVWGQSLWQSLFLVSALQGGNSASDAKQWRIWSFSGEWCSEDSVLKVPWFLSSQYISSTGLAKPFKNKNIWERAWCSEITAGLGFFSSLLWFSWWQQCGNPAQGHWALFSSVLEVEAVPSIMCLLQSLCR